MPAPAPHTPHAPPLPRRILARAIPLLLLGAATTIIVAATLSALVSHRGQSRIPALRNLEENVADGYLIFQTCLQRWSGVEVLSWRFDQYVPGPAWHAIALEQDPELPAWSSLRDDRARRAAEVRTSPATPNADWLAGWPQLALRGRLKPDSFVATPRTQYRDGMLRFPNSQLLIPIGNGPHHTGHLFPLIPIWPGFLIDTLFFAALWWLLLSAFATARRALRRRRNQCPACAYDLRATPPNAPCPECGRAPPRR